jgi:hypothetical protein
MDSMPRVKLERYFAVTAGWRARARVRPEGEREEEFAQRSGTLIIGSSRGDFLN